MARPPKAKVKPTRNKKVNKSEYENEVYNDIISNSSSKTFELTYKINTKFKSVKQKELFDILMEKSNRIIFISGAAGTGKSFISLMAALICLKEKEYNISKILLSVLAVESGPSLGFLPGDEETKLSPYYVAFWANISKLIGSGWVRSLKDSKQIEEVTLNYVRGQTFNNYDINGNCSGYVAILDELQNTNVQELKTYLSRLGENSKIICLGDPDQIDRKFSKFEKNGLDDAFERFQGLEGVKFVEFTEDDIVRDKFLIEIMKRYKTK